MAIDAVLGVIRDLAVFDAEGESSGGVIDPIRAVIFYNAPVYGNVSIFRIDTIFWIILDNTIEN